MDIEVRETVPTLLRLCCNIRHFVIMRPLNPYIVPLSSPDAHQMMPDEGCYLPIVSSVPTSWQYVSNGHNSERKHVKFSASFMPSLGWVLYSCTPVLLCILLSHFTSLSGQFIESFWIVVLDHCSGTVVSAIPKPLGNSVSSPGVSDGPKNLLPCLARLHPWAPHVKLFCSPLSQISPLELHDSPSFKPERPQQKSPCVHLASIRP